MATAWCIFGWALDIEPPPIEQNHLHCKILHLDWSDCHVYAYLVFSQFLQSGHDEPYVVEVLNRPTQSLVDILDKVKDLIHARSVSSVAVFAEAQAPGSGFRAES